MYIPRILLCGDRENFLQKIEGMKIDIVGQVSFKGNFERGEAKIFFDLNEIKTDVEPEGFQIFLNDMEISHADFKKFMNEVANYIVFDNPTEIFVRYEELLRLGIKEKFITTQTLLKYARDNFYSINDVALFLRSLYKLKISRVLDVDNYFANNNTFYAWLNPDDMEIEAIDKNSFAQKYPVVENLYSKIYSSLDECLLKNYDALLITADREPADFFKLLKATDGMTKKILLFVGKGSQLTFWLKRYESAFEIIERAPLTNGEWVFLQKRKPPQDFACYVVTHKDVKLDLAALPDGYKIIHAGHLQAKEDFGYLGDDTGDNISRLNRYLNEITALYWMWKNTSHTVIGLCHYRRFFTARMDWEHSDIYKEELDFDADKILTAPEAMELLRGCDMIIVKSYMFVFTQTEIKSMLFSSRMNNYFESVFRKYIALRQPDYLEAFDYVSSSHSEFLYEMFITRRHVFEAYCEWLFSFIIDVTEEILATTDTADIDNPIWYRSIGLIAERLMSVWLLKNHLRLKMLPIMFREDV